jgi:Zn-dependent protease
VLELSPERIAWALTYGVVLLFSLTVHECAHAWVALLQGDDTAARQGRITLNPGPHIDPIGTLLIPALQILGTGIPLMGWAKPVPVSAQNFRRLSRGHILVSGAGPLSNLVLALFFTLGLVGAYLVRAEPDGPMMALVTAGIQMNVMLALLNLVPLPPLDGSWVVSWGLPRRFGSAYDRMVEPYGQWILLVLFATGALGFVLLPPVQWATIGLYGVARSIAGLLI